MKRKGSLKKEDRCTLDLLIISVIKENRPERVDQLVKLVVAKGYREEEIVEEISRLEKLGKLSLKSDMPEARRLKKCLFSSSAFWYWGVMIFCLMAIASILAIPSDWFPFVYIRWVSGLILLLYVPGFCLAKSLFPKKEITNTELVTLSICFSLILIVFVGLFWNFTPLGLSDVPIVVTLTTISAILATVAVFQRTRVK